MPRASRDDSKEQTGETPAETGTGAPRSREEVVRPFSGRRRDEPALAPFETDAEAGNFGGRYAGRPMQRDEMGKPIDPARQAGETEGDARPGDPADIRIGPGDAGRQRKPRVLPERLQGRRDSWSRVGIVLAIGLVVGLLFALIY
jgi:hypothetical protein